MLRQVELKNGLLAKAIIDTLEKLPHLRKILIHGADPEKHLWSITLPLTHVGWEIDLERWRSNLWPSVKEFLTTAVTTCPDLVSLDVSFKGYTTQVLGRQAYMGGREIVTEGHMPQHYPHLDISASSLSHLKHFGFYGGFVDVSGGSLISNTDLEAGILGFVERHKETLISLALPIDLHDMRRRLEYVVYASRKLPRLTSLALQTQCDQPYTSRHPMPFQYLEEMICAITESNPLLEQFSMSAIGTTFASSTGRLFRPWQNLRFLRLSDEGSKKPSDDRGMMDLNSWRPVSYFKCTRCLDVDNSHRSLSSSRNFLHH